MFDDDAFVEQYRTIADEIQTAAYRGDLPTLDRFIDSLCQLREDYNVEYDAYMDARVTDCD